MSVKTEKYDPSFDQLGIHGGRSGVQYSNWGSSRTGMAFEEQPKTSSLSEDQKRAYIEYMQQEDEMTKEAEEFKAPSSIAKPMIRDLGENTIPPSYRAKTDTDLQVHGSGDIEPMTARDLIKAQINSARAHFDEKPKDIIQRKVERQEESRAKHMSLSPKIRIDRRELDVTHANLMKKSHDQGILENGDLNPIQVFAACKSFWGEEWLDWEPETIEQTAEEDGIKIHPINMGKMFAIRSILKTDSFFEDPRVFSKVCIAFASKHVDWAVIQKPRTYEVAATVALVDRFLKDGEYSDDVSAFVAACALDDGFVQLPPQLTFADFQFSTELALTMGDDVLDFQKSVMEALESEDISDLEPKFLVQYKRLMKCQFHVQDMINEAT